MIGFLKCGTYSNLSDHFDNLVPGYIKNKIRLNHDKF